jgi:hypothetical protein
MEDFLMATQLSFGLLWYDGDRKRTLSGKIERAVQRYQAKFGQRPNICYVHQGSLEQETEWQGVRIVGVANVLPDHFWVGVSSPQRS